MKRSHAAAAAEDAVGPLAPSPPPPLRIERRLSEDLLYRLGLKTSISPESSQPTEEYAWVLEEFRAAAGDSPDATLSKSQFQCYASQHWQKCDPDVAAAAFDVADADGSGRLNRHEFALLVRAFVSTRPGDDHVVPEVAQLKASLQAKVQVQQATSSRVVLDPRNALSVADAPPTARRVVSTLAGETTVNDSFTLDPALRVADGADWRGALAQPRGTQVFQVASQVVDKAQRLVRRLSTEPGDQSDNGWLGDGMVWDWLFGTRHFADVSTVVQLLSAEVQRIAKAQPMVVRVPVPAKVVGDVHGQLRDLLLLFLHHGFPSHHGGDVEAVAYVFNGDFVDRGAHQLEVVALLFALKTLYPARIFLVRGNHEFRTQNHNMQAAGFHAHLQTRLGELWQVTYDAVHSAFDWLPLGAILNEAVFVVHGGLGDGSWSVAELAQVRRPLREDYGDGVPKCVTHALWSDPSDSDSIMARGVHPNPRGAGIVTFGPDVTHDFCQRNRVELVIRSHQFVPDGVRFLHGGRLCTLFSARNYFDQHSNDAAILLLAYDEQNKLRVRAKRLAHRVAGWDDATVAGGT